MEISASCCHSEMGIDELSFIQQWEMGSLDQFIGSLDQFIGQQVIAPLFTDSYASIPSSFDIPPESTTTKDFSISSTNTSHSAGSVEKPKKLLETSSWGSSITNKISALAPSASSSPIILSFANQDSPSEHSSYYGSCAEDVKPKDLGLLIPHGSKRKCETVAEHGNKRVKVEGRPPSSSNQEHILSERRRREKLSQRFIALSAIIPGLKKLDKATVLGDAIKYVKQLQEKVKALEDQSAKKKVESVVFIKKSKLTGNDDGCSSSDENFNGNSIDNTLPEIEARISDKMVSMKIQCENRKGVVVKALAEIEKLHLTITNVNAMTFMGSTMDITVVAQMEEGFSMTPKDLVKKLNSACRQFA